MDDLIYRQAAIDCMVLLQREDEETYGASIPEGFDGDRAAEALNRLPSAQHRPFCYLYSPCPYQNEEIKVTQKKGHWVIKHEDYHGLDATYAVCSECGKTCSDYGINEEKARFCSWCGADMRGADGKVDMRGEENG